MHTYIGIRGSPAQNREYLNFLTSQYLPFEVLEKGDKKPTPYLAKLVVREFKILEVIHPEDSEDIVMGLIKPNELHGASSKFTKPLKWLAKALGLKKCTTNFKRNLTTPTEGMQIIPIGTKADKLNWTKKTDNSNNVFDIGMPKENL